MFISKAPWKSKRELVKYRQIDTDMRCNHIATIPSLSLAYVDDKRPSGHFI